MKALKLRNPFKKSKSLDPSPQPSDQPSGSHSQQSGDNGQQTREEPGIWIDTAVDTVDQDRTDSSMPFAGGGSQASGTASADDPAVDSIGENDSLGIKILYNPPYANLDVVFVHGLTGSAYSTWLHEGSGTHWPRDLIKDDIKDARVMTFGYDADVVRFWHQTAQDGISGYANDLLGKLARKRQGVGKRKIVFVVHSLGGLITQRALFFSRDSRFAHLQAIEASTVGICFLGTPHYGSDLAKWGDTLASIANVAKPANTAPIKVLKRDSEILRDLQDAFHNLLEKRKIEGMGIGLVCFYETLPLVRFLVVPKESAVISGELSYPLHANHVEMIKFSSRAAPGYDDVVGEIQRLVTEDNVHSLDSSPGGRRRATQSAPEAETQQQCERKIMHSNEQNGPHYYIPFQRNKCFVGRNDKLQEVMNKLFVNGTCPKVALVGLGGVGKTQAALEIAYQVKDTRPECSIFWVPAVSIESFEQAFLEIAALLQIPDFEDSKVDDIKQSVKRALSAESAGQWLFIVDNADDAKFLPGSESMTLDLSEYVPESASGSIIYTTRNEDMAFHLADDVVFIGNMSLEAATELLRMILPRKNLLEDKKVAEELLKELEFLPLAITQAAAYIIRNKISIQTYMGLLKDTETEQIAVLSREFEDKTRYKGSRNAVAATWIISFNQIRASDENAANYLAFMSCIEPRMIPHAILPPLDSKESTIHVLGTLSAYSFVTTREDGQSYDLHRLVHLATRNWLQEQGFASLWVDRSIKHLANIFPSGEEWTKRAIWRQYLPHAFRVANSNGAEESEHCGELYTKVGNCLVWDGRLRDAHRWLSKACTWALAKFGADHATTVAYEVDYADLLRRMGNHKRATELLEHVLQVQDRTLIEDGPQRLTTEHYLARAHLWNGRVQEAIQLLEHIAQVQERIISENDPKRLEFQTDLARAYLENGQVQKAIQLLEHAVQAAARIHVADHPDKLVSQYYLAKACLEDGQVQRAIQLLEHAVQVAARIRAEDDEDRLIAEQELARAYLENGQVQKAIQLLEHAVQIQERILAEGNPELVRSRKLLARAYEMAKVHEAKQEV